MAPGGFFLQQRIKLDFASFPIEALEMIGYDAETGRFPSTVYSAVFGTPYDIWGSRAD